jgi:hypothetical protein
MKGIAVALVLGLLSSPAAAHGWYTDLKIPNGPMAGSSCCNEMDCHPTDYCKLPDGKQGLISRFGCVSIPWDKVLGIASPDGKPSICEAPYTTNFVPYCVVLGGDS